MDQGLRSRRTAGNQDIDRQDFADPVAPGIRACEHAAAYRTRASGNDQLGLGHGFVRPPGRFLQVPRHDPRDEQQVGMAGRGDKVDPESLDVVVGVQQGGDLPIAAIAGAGVEMTDVK